MTHIFFSTTFAPAFQTEVWVQLHFAPYQSTSERTGVIIPCPCRDGWYRGRRLLPSSLIPSETMEHYKKVTEDDLINNLPHYIEMARQGKLLTHETEHSNTPNFRLPEELLHTPYFKQAAFEKALLYEYVRVKDSTHLEWRGRSKSDFAYFVGRVWCGDSLVHVCQTDTYHWKKGSGFYPETAINKLFKTSGTRDIRKKRTRKDHNTAPFGHENIDRLFI